MRDKVKKLLVLLMIFAMVLQYSASLDVLTAYAEEPESTVAEEPAEPVEGAEPITETPAEPVPSAETPAEGNAENPAAETTTQKSGTETPKADVQEQNAQTAAEAEPQSTDNTLESIEVVSSEPKAADDESTEEHDVIADPNMVNGNIKIYDSWPGGTEKKKFMEGDTFTIVVTPDPGYMLARIYRIDNDGTASGSTSEYTVQEAPITAVMGKYDRTIYAEFERKDLIIKTRSPQGGYVSTINGQTTAKVGDTVIIEAYAMASGNKVKEVFYTGEDGEKVACELNTDGYYSFTMPESEVTVSAELEEFDASWFASSPEAAWDVVDGAKKYVVTANKIGADGKSEAASDPATEDATGVTGDHDFSKFIQENGAGKYSFTVKAYRSDETTDANLIATTVSDALDFYYLHIDLVALDPEENEIANEGNFVVVTINGSGERVEEDADLFRTNGFMELQVTAGSIEGFEFKGMILTGDDGVPQSYTEPEKALTLDQSYGIKLVFQQTEEKVEIKLDTIHEEVADTILNGIKADSEEDDAIHDEDASRSGAVITFKVPKSWFYSDVKGALMDIVYNLDGTKADEEVLDAQLIGNKPSEEYKSIKDFEEEDNSTGQKQIKAGQTLYLFWRKPVRNADITIENPICGTPVSTTIVQPDEDQIIPIKQDNAPSVAYSEGIDDDYSVAFWLNKKPEYMPTMNDFLVNTTITGGESYYVYQALLAKFGYYIDDKTVITVNGESPISVIAFGAQANVIASITADHDWDEGKVTKEATTTSKGEKTYTCKHCAATKTEEYGPLEEYTITYDLNGGTMDGKTGTVTVKAAEGTVITLPEPTRDGYVFDYWKGSAYNAGDKYTVNEDHTFTAQWLAVAEEDEDSDTTDSGSSSKKSTGVKTGDAAHLMGWLMLAIAAEAGAVYVYRRRRDY